MRGLRIFLLLGVVVMVCFATAPFLVWRASIEPEMGIVQKIFYYHVSAAWVTLMSAVICGGASLIFLFRRGRAWDALAAASGELALVFGAMVLVSGPLWARRAWGVWWTWEPRLTSTLLLWLIFLAYVFLRRYGGAGAPQLAAGLAVLGALDVPIIWWAFKFGSKGEASAGSHPPGREVVRSGLDPSQLRAFLFCLLAFTLLYILLLVLRTRQHRLAQRLDDLYIAAGLEE